MYICLKYLILQSNNKNALLHIKQQYCITLNFFENKELKRESSLRDSTSLFKNQEKKNSVAKGSNIYCSGTHNQFEFTFHPLYQIFINTTMIKLLLSKFYISMGFYLIIIWLLVFRFTGYIFSDSVSILWPSPAIVIKDTNLWE